jgi:hypothetical protein
MIVPYSQSKFITPASKVSVPLTVVMRTRSSVPDSPTTLADIAIAPEASVLRTSPLPTQLLEFMFVKTTCPQNPDGADDPLLIMWPEVTPVCPVPELIAAA